jgi:hypothetical protein
MRRIVLLGAVIVSLLLANNHAFAFGTPKLLHSLRAEHGVETHLRALVVEPQTALASVSFSGETCASGTFSGSVNVSEPYTGTVTVELFYNPGQAEFSPPMTTTVSFNDSTSGTYSFSGLAPTGPPSGPASYLAGAVGSSGTPQLDSSATHAKSTSLECTGAATDTPTNTPTNTPIPTDTPTNTPIPTDTPTNTPVATDTPTNTPIPTDTPTNTPIPTDTPTGTLVATDTPTDTPVATDTPTDTPVATDTPTDTATPTPTSTTGPAAAPVTDTPTSTPVPTSTSVPTDTPTPAPTATNTTVPAVSTPTPKPSPKPTKTKTSGKGNGNGAAPASTSTTAKTPTKAISPAHHAKPVVTKVAPIPVVLPATGMGGMSNAALNLVRLPFSGGGDEAVPGAAFPAAIGSILLAAGIALRKRRRRK